ncbi:hypothetical protein [Leifsonia sp. 2MCAF36]|uniref:hypothetical protein n=1 Tax=Leifsonia sp. 2MCAF36 TaxID=3232988 RepID=UPI003F9A9B3F
MPHAMEGKHSQLAGDLRSRVENTGTLDPKLRLAILARASGGPALAVPYDALAEQIADQSFRVTNAQVQAVLLETGSEKDAFEVVLTVAVAAGLRRWEAAQKAIEEADHAAT